MAEIHLVIATRKSGCVDYAIFSTLDRARDWCISLPNDDYDHTITAPFVIDVPEFGNVAKREQQ